MSLKRDCLLCGNPVAVQRRMSLFCSEACETRYAHLKAATPPPSETAGRKPASGTGEGDAPRSPSHSRA